MRPLPSLLLVLALFLLPSAAQEPSTQARLLEDRGDSIAARSLLEQAVRDRPDDLSALAAYAEFLDRRKDPAARGAYEKLLNLAGRSGDSRRRAEVARRLVLLDLLEEDQSAAARHLAEYRSAGGPPLALPAAAPQSPAASQPTSTIHIPGPLRSFARMAALSPDLAPSDLLPALARNVVTNGYQASSSAESLDQTEYLKLVVRYLSQARELERLAGESKTIRIEACESTQTGDLLRVLGYRMRGACGSDVVLETVNASRAFLTIDSGFPLAELEQALRTNRPFLYEYRPTEVPVLYSPEYWLPAKEKRSGEFIDVFLSDPSICRLYLGLAKLDPATSAALRKAVPVQRIRAFAHVLDFFGGMFQIVDDKAVVPGAPRTTQTWADMVGVSPDQGAAFFERLIARDDGWMTSYFDSLARISGPTKEYLTEPARMKRFYMAVRGRVTSPGPARPVFRSNTDLMLLTTRLKMQPDGKPHIPGGIEVWKNLFIKHPHGKYDGKLTRAASGWKEPDDVVEALFALCRKAVENEPLKIFMALSDLDRNRAQPLDPVTVDRLAREWRRLGAQYSVLNETPLLSDKTILQFLDTANAVGQIRDQGLRADAAGTMQALTGLWQIFCRQGLIPESDLDSTLSSLLSGFLKIRSNRDLFASGRSGVKALLKATRSAEDVSPQDRIIDLLAGAADTQDRESHDHLVQEMVRIFETQRLVSLKTLFDLDDHLDAVSRGEKLNTALVNRLATRISEIQLPRAALSGVEKNSMAFGYWTDRHIENQRRLNLRSMVERAGADPEKLKDIRGQLAPVLRDTLVGLNYIHYTPPGAQVLLTNPLFVRSHDFLGVQGSQQTWRACEVFGTGWPSNAGGRLVGSLSGLPYALAEAEQNFLIPSREQALIWGDLVPQMILSAKIPRWWQVSPVETRWVALHMRYAESLLAESALDPGRRKEFVEALARHAPPARVDRVRSLVEQGRAKSAIEFLMPSEMYVVSSELAAKDGSGSMLSREIQRLRSQYPDRVSERNISRAFGTPKPTLTNSYRPELLHLRSFPTLMGYSSRIMAESWESSTLFYAALADQAHLSPTQLNVLIPEWTQMTVERIFATHLEDWPALLRSLRLVGEDVLLKARGQAGAGQKASLE